MIRTCEKCGATILPNTLLLIDEEKLLCSECYPTIKKRRLNLGKMLRLWKRDR